MKFFIAFAALVAFTAASPLTKPVHSDNAELEAIIAAINSPSTDPATATLLEEQLFEIIGALNPIAVGPAIIPTPVKPEVVEVKPEPIAVGPEIVTFPVVPSPVVVGDIPAGTSPLVQIIVNINQASAEVAPVAPVPIVKPEPVGVVKPEEIVDVTPVVVKPVQVGRPVPVGVLDPVETVDVTPVVKPVHIGRPVPVGVLEPVVDIVAEPVQIVDAVPVAVEPVLVALPVLPEPAVILPEELN